MHATDYAEFLETGRGLWLPIQQIDEINEVDSAISFYRDYVSRNMPVVIRGKNALATILFITQNILNKQVDASIGAHSRNGGGQMMRAKEEEVEKSIKNTSLKGAKH